MGDNDLAFGPYGRPQLMARKCATCILRRGADFVPPHVVANLVERHRRVGAMVTCHETLDWGPHPELGATACRGFYDVYHHENTAATFAHQRLGGFDQIEPPGVTDQPDYGTSDMPITGADQRAKV
jgi:hypothetical protein